MIAVRKFRKNRRKTAVNKPSAKSKLITYGVSPINCPMADKCELRQLTAPLMFELADSIGWHRLGEVPIAMEFPSAVVGQI